MAKAREVRVKRAREILREVVRVQMNTADGGPIVIERDCNALADILLAERGAYAGMSSVFIHELRLWGDAYRIHENARSDAKLKGGEHVSMIMRQETHYRLVVEAEHREKQKWARIIKMLLQLERGEFPNPDAEET